ncbi:hypothetical protein DEA8626_04042 [Defluviimonas aquaemixtae]|uniref:Uncharacterized protein n=1 Tax=Albidovulum aquaemixtae TaxID=1542388 RepID=A0A2R8BNS9_9RHOB|nr:hypothetical protein [Defluviimonas aquaemixtae]SPH25007.1 hypothetical protein DEA8626_04042 [Defluviimonas aquaemixtae]
MDAALGDIGHVYLHCGIHACSAVLTFEPVPATKTVCASANAYAASDDVVLTERSATAVRNADYGAEIVKRHA